MRPEEDVACNTRDHGRRRRRPAQGDATEQEESMSKVDIDIVTIKATWKALDYVGAQKEEIAATRVAMLATLEAGLNIGVSEFGWLDYYKVRKCIETLDC
jgi:hypothetical protein